MKRKRMKRSNKTKTLRLLSFAALLWSLALWFEGCSSQHQQYSYVAVRRGAEDDVNALKLTLSLSPASIGDTLFFLSPLIDNLNRYEFSTTSKAAQLFERYPSHPILMEERQFKGNGIFFRSAWFPISNTDSVMFEYRGTLHDDSISGLLVSSMYLRRLRLSVPDTSVVTFVVGK